MLFVLPLFGGAALAYEFVVYPAQGQSEEQTEQDKFTCLHRFDPGRAVANARLSLATFQRQARHLLRG